MLVAIIKLSSLNLHQTSFQNISHRKYIAAVKEGNTNAIFKDKKQDLTKSNVLIQQLANDQLIFSHPSCKITLICFTFECHNQALVFLQN
jgi:hypothetical protein